MSAVISKEDSCFELKADFFPITVLKLLNNDLTSLSKQLDDKIKTAPKYFAHAPVILDVIDLRSAKAEINLSHLCKILRDKNVIPIGVRGLSPQEQSLAIAEGLAVIKGARSLDNHQLDNDEPVKQEEIKPEIESLSKQNQIKPKIITRPIRSGTQIYAKNTDLVVLAAVNVGAECLADGNIHVYGPLRGKALAGASGNKEARIFCESLDPELIAIAGEYLLHDQIKVPKTKKPMLQIYLDNDKLKIEGI